MYSSIYFLYLPVSLINIDSRDSRQTSVFYTENVLLSITLFVLVGE